MDQTVKAILESNANTFRERNDIYALTESQAAQVEQTMMSRLYKSALEKAYIDFDDIPESKGDITKYQGYKAMRETLSIMDNLAAKSNIKIKELDAINEALRHIETNRDYFVKGFLLDNQLVILIYNVTVASCVRATSLVVSSYMEFVRDPNTVEFKIIDVKKQSSRVDISTIEGFNKATKSGKLTLLLKEETSTKDNFVGNALVLSAVIVGAAMAIVPIIREMIFGFYYSRVRIAEYLDHQQELINMNRSLLESSTLSAKDKRAVLSKQKHQADQISRLSDKIRVDAVKTTTKASTELKNETKTWDLNSVQNEFASKDASGFNML